MYNRGQWIGGNSKGGEWRREALGRNVLIFYSPLEYYNFLWNIMVQTKIWFLYFYNMLIHKNLVKAYYFYKKGIFYKHPSFENIFYILSEFKFLK